MKLSNLIIGFFIVIFLTACGAKPTESNMQNSLANNTSSPSAEANKPQTEEVEDKVAEVVTPEKSNEVEEFLLNKTATAMLCVYSYLPSCIYDVNRQEGKVTFSESSKGEKWSVFESSGSLFLEFKGEKSKGIYKLMSFNGSVLKAKVSSGTQNRYLFLYFSK